MPSNTLDKNLQKLKFDVRMREWNLRNGVVSEEEMKKHLQGLEDVANNAAKMELKDDSGDSNSH